MCLPCASTGFLIVSRYATFGSSSVTSTPNLFLSFETITSRCCSPRPESTCSLVSLLSAKVIVGSSSISLVRPAATFSSSPFFDTLTAIERHGFGKSTPASLSMFFGSQSVSPVLTPAIFVTTPISPAMIAGASSCFAPFTNTILPIFSISPVRKLYAAVSGASLPETTLKNDILPTNGSAIVLKQTAASGPFSSQGKIPSSPFS